MDTKLAVGTSSMIMTLAALTGAVSHVAMGAYVDLIPVRVKMAAERNRYKRSPDGVSSGLRFSMVNYRLAE